MSQYHNSYELGNGSPVFGQSTALHQSSPELMITRKSGSLFAICELLFVISFEPKARNERTN
jgi:hypothetical protein